MSKTPPHTSIALLTLFTTVLFCIAPFKVQSDSGTQTFRQQVETLQNTYRDLSSLTFDFSQTTRTGGRERLGKGNAVFLRPNQPGETKSIQQPGVIRWNYTEPDEQVIINDGSQLSIYTKKDKQMLVTPADELEADITYAFFSGKKNLLDDFKAEPPEKRFIFSTASSSLQSVRLVPRTPHPQVKSIQLWFDGSALIHQLIIEDHFDSVTELSFSNIVLNGIAADDPKQLREILNLALPPGTEIITQ